jgi:hypothetical protein
MRLLNLTSNKYLREGSGDQPNLSLIANSTIVNVSFVTQEFGSSELNRTKAGLGKLMALLVDKEYVYVEKTTGGPVLRTGKIPKFEWYAIGVANIGTEPTTRMAFGLFNTKARDFLVFRERGASTVPLGWDKDNKSAAYMRSRIFVQNLKKQGFTPMADLVKRLMGL